MDLFAALPFGIRCAMTITMYGIPNCDTVKKARTWLSDRGIAYAFHDFKKAGVSTALLSAWCDAHSWETILNRAGTTFKKLPDDAKMDLDQDKAIVLMLAQPSMIKRPVVESAGQTLVGFKPEVYECFFAMPSRSPKTR
jgi:arsenate reductase (glutaredoxin)